jgi:hypothetical protein
LDDWSLATSTYPQVVGESTSGKNRGTSVPVHCILLQKLTITLLNQNNKRQQLKRDKNEIGSTK